MKRTLIATVLILSASSVLAFDPHQALLPPADMPALATASWFSDDGWAVVAAIIVMLVIAKRNGKR